MGCAFIKSRRNKRTQENTLEGDGRASIPQPPTPKDDASNEPSNHARQKATESLEKFKVIRDAMYDRHRNIFEHAKMHHELAEKLSLLIAQGLNFQNSIHCVAGDYERLRSLAEKTDEQELLTELGGQLTAHEGSLAEVNRQIDAVRSDLQILEKRKDHNENQTEWMKKMYDFDIRAEQMKQDENWVAMLSALVENFAVLDWMSRYLDVVETDRRGSLPKSYTEVVRMTFDKHRGVSRMIAYIEEIITKLSAIKAPQS